MLIGDFLSIENFYFLFEYLRDLAREKYNYQFELNKENKNKLGRLMETIYENNYNTMDKVTANKIIINEFTKIIKRKSQTQFFDNEKVDKLEVKHEIRPLIDFNKPSDLVSDKFNSIFKKQAKEIESHFITEKKHQPQEIFKNVLKSLEFKEHDLSKAPKNEREELLIPQPDIFKNMFDKQLLIENALIFLDSRDRNHDSYPNSENYNIKLDSTFKNVISIELLHAILPNSDYIINNRNNTIHFQETSGVTLTASINNGNYTNENDIASALENAMKNIGESDYTVNFDSSSKKYTILSDRTGGDGLFILKFKGSNEIFGSNGVTRTSYLSNSIGPVLGFSKIDLPDKSSHTSQSVSNISTDRSLYMFINADSKDSFDNIEGLKTRDTGKFMKFGLTSKLGKPTYWINPRAKVKNLTDVERTNKNQLIPERSIAEQINKNENDYKLIFNPPISIDKLQIQFKNYNDEYFEFHGLEHSLLFRVEMFNFHYDNILQDYKFPDLISEESIIENIIDDFDKNDKNIYLKKSNPNQDNILE